MTWLTGLWRIEGAGFMTDNITNLNRRDVMKASAAAATAAAAGLPVVDARGGNGTVA